MTNPLGPDVERDRVRLAALRQSLSEARSSASTPAIARALDVAGSYVFLAMTYLGHTDSLFPEEGSDDTALPKSR